MVPIRWDMACCGCHFGRVEADERREDACRVRVSQYWLLNRADWNRLIAGSPLGPIAKLLPPMRLYSPLMLLRNLEYRIRSRRRRHHADAGVSEDVSFVALVDVAELEVVAEPFVNVM